MVDKNKEKEESSLGENLSAVGQMIVGEIEMVGGILTGDPVTRAEGEFNAEVGKLHQESNKNLTAIKQNEEAHQQHRASESSELNRSEDNE